MDHSWYSTSLRITRCKFISSAKKRGKKKEKQFPPAPIQSTYVFTVYSIADSITYVFTVYGTAHRSLLRGAGRAGWGGTTAPPHHRFIPFHPLVSTKPVTKHDVFGFLFDFFH